MSCTATLMSFTFARGFEMHQQFPHSEHRARTFQSNILSTNTSNSISNANTPLAKTPRSVFANEEYGVLNKEVSSDIAQMRP